MSYLLEKYKGRATRHKCPNCGRENCFTYYLDENGNMFDKIVGRCNHQNSCGYDYHPKQFFIDYPERKPTNQVYQYQYTNKRQTLLHQANGQNTTKTDTKKKTSTINHLPIDVKNHTFSLCSRFIEFLCSIFDRYTLESPTIKRLVQLYGIDATKDGKTIFLQIDKNFNVRTGKIIDYNATTGHRNKESGIDWLHSIMKRKNRLPENFELLQCLFGEHLLSYFPNKTIALVEAEKTAIIGAGAIPDYLWIAVGSKQLFSAKTASIGYQILQVLKGRNIIIFPDVDGFKQWSETANELNKQGFNCVVSDIVQRNANETETKIDIADLIIKQLKNNTKIIAPKTTLEIMIEKQPLLQYLIETFDLKAV